MAGRSFELWRRWHARFSTTGKRGKRRQIGQRRAGSPQGARVESLEAREMLTVTYNGGALLTNVEAQAVYLGSDWSTNSTLQGQAQATDKFLATLVDSPYMDMLTNAGYGVGRGTASAGTVDRVGVNSVISDSQIQSDLASMISSGQVQAPDANRLYMVYVQPGVEVTLGSADSATSFLGYHGAFADGGNVIHYAVMVYPGSPNPSAASQGFSSNFNEETSVSSHELAEAVTDPNVNFSTLGWYDSQRNGEIADLAEGHESTITDANGVQYVVQDVVNKNDQVISPSTTQPPTNPPPTTPPPSNPGLSAPALTGAATSTTTAQLSWSAVSGTQGYRVYEVTGGQAVLLGTVNASTTAVQVTGLTAGTTVSFEVAAFNSASVADSNVVSVTTPAPQVAHVSAPHVAAQAASSTSVLLSWGAEAQATGYNIYWSNGYNVVFLGTVGAATTNVTITGLQPGSGSYFLVEAFNSVSRADSQWTYAATPFYSFGNEAFFSQYAEQQQPSHGGSHTSASHSAALDGQWTWRPSSITRPTTAATGAARCPTA